MIGKEIDLSTLFSFDFGLNIHDTAYKTEIYKAIMAVPKTKWVQTNGKRIEMLAYEIYKDVNKWSLLAIFNDIVDPFVLPERLYFIPKEELSKILGR